MTCKTCQIDETMVAAQMAKYTSMDVAAKAKTIAFLGGKSDNDLHGVYGHQTATIREIVRRMSATIA